MTQKLQWGIIATGNIAAAFARALKHARRGELLAVASRNQEGAELFGKEHEAQRRYGAYDALLEDPDVDAVYISTPHPMHAEWAIKCAQAGKHILCEKPMTLNARDTERVIEAARSADVFLMEAFMYRCHPQTERLVELLQSGNIGEIRIIHAFFGFNREMDHEGRHLNNALGGGGIMDVGCYPVSMSRLVAGIAIGRDFVDPIEVHGAGRVGETRVDEWAVATLEFENGIVAQTATAVQVGLGAGVHIFGSHGEIVVPDPWLPSREGGATTIEVRNTDRAPRFITVETSEWLYGIEADHVADNLDRRQGRFPAMTWDDSLGNAKTLDRWRAAVGVVYDADSKA